MSVLLVWEEVPESTTFYLLDGDAADAAVAAHQCYVNMVDGDPQGAADKLSELLVGIKPLNLDDGPISADDIEKIVVSGFLL